MASVVHYRRATFVTRLPVTHRYTPAHCWLAPADEGGRAGGGWRVGYTRFALRMLGELVDIEFQCQAGAAVRTGDIIGAIEGFKALSDVYCAGTGEFLGSNPALNESLKDVVRSPYEAGWLYAFAGDPDSRAMDVAGYCALLDATIDRMQEQQHEPT